MTNRQRLLKTNEHDLLCRMNRNIRRGAVCVIDAIQFADRQICRSRESCEECIEKWLNEEEQR